jgi:hypothetical protein
MWNCFASFPLIFTNRFGPYYCRLCEAFCLVNFVSELSDSSEETKLKHGSSLSFYTYLLFALSEILIRGCTRMTCTEIILKF